MKEEAPKVIIKFEPTTNFEREFLEFVEEVLGWAKEEKNLNPKKDANSQFSNN
jgi:hypothetical protein